jgi:hypothetical protein
MSPAPTVAFISRRPSQIPAPLMPENHTCDSVFAVSSTFALPTAARSAPPSAPASPSRRAGPRPPAGTARSRALRDCGSIFARLSTSPDSFLTSPADAPACVWIISIDCWKSIAILPAANATTPSGSARACRTEPTPREHAARSPPRRHAPSPRRPSDARPDRDHRPDAQRGRAARTVGAEQPQPNNDAALTRHSAAPLASLLGPLYVRVVRLHRRTENGPGDHSFDERASVVRGEPRDRPPVHPQTDALTSSRNSGAASTIPPGRPQRLPRRDRPS